MLSTKYFPFCPRVPWKVKNGIYVLPELSGVSWKKANEGRMPLVICYGGLIESFLSLSFFELYNFISPSTVMKWSGHEVFLPLVKINNLAKPGPIIDEGILQRFPLPIFMDREKTLYCNFMYNYLKKRPYYGGAEKVRREPIFQQALENMTQPWQAEFLPQMRNIVSTKLQLETYAKSKQFSFKLPFICIFPDREFSIHPQSALKWTDMEIKALAAGAKALGINTLVITNKPGRYYNSHVICVPSNLETSLYLVSKSKLVLSEEIDWLLITGMISSAKIVQRELNTKFDIAENLAYVGKTADIFRSRNPRPSDVYQLLGTA